MRIFKHFFNCMLAMVFFAVCWHLLYMNWWRLNQTFHQRTWIWGDSQLYESLDPNKWRGLQSVWLDMDHGYGFQDLISFTERFPQDASGIVSFGPLFYRVNTDRNQGGLCIECVQSLVDFKKLVDNEYALWNALLKNMRVEYSTDIFQDAEGRINVQKVDRQKREEYINTIEEAIEAIDLRPVFSFKDSVIIESVAKLESKAEILLLVSLPISEELRQSSFSQVHEHYSSILGRIAQENNFEVDTLAVHFSEDPFHDATHVNRTIYSRLNDQLISYWSSLETSTVLIVKFDQN